MIADSQFPCSTPFQTLTASQRNAFIEFKDLCDRNGVNWPGSELEPASTRGVNNDITLLRYLRARQYDPKAAFKQYSASAAWRRRHELDSTYDHAEIERFETIIRLLPQWTGRRDRKGIPVFVYSVSGIQTSDVLRVYKEDPELTSVFLAAEYCTQFVQPLCGKLRGDNAVDCSTNIIDLSGVGVRTFWNLRSLLQISSQMATAHYPESVERIFVVGAPSFFPTVWSFVTKWFDPQTTSKIKILAASEVKSTLSEYIEPANFPKRFGGELDWDFGMDPILDGEAEKLTGQMALGWVRGPIRTLKKPEGAELLAVGSENGKARRQLLAQPDLGVKRRDSKLDTTDQEISMGNVECSTITVTA